jgi:MFS family permease
MVTEWGMSSKEIGLLFLAEIFPTFISEPLSGIITDKYGPKIIVYPFWLLCAASTMLLGIPNKNTRGGIAPLIVILAVSAFSSSACLTPVVPEIAHVVRSQNEDDGDDGMGRSYGMFNIAFALGGVVGPLLGGYIYSAIGFFWLFIIMGGTYLISAPFVFYFIGERGEFIKRSDQKTEELPEENENDRANC